MTTPKFKESGHKRYTRLNLGKPHIMWCPHLGIWVLAAYSWVSDNVDQSMIQPSTHRAQYLSARCTPRSSK